MTNNPGYVCPWYLKNLLDKDISGGFMILQYGNEGCMWEGELVGRRAGGTTEKVLTSL
jgi:hypothetical protein